MFDQLLIYSSPKVISTPHNKFLRTTHIKQEYLQRDTSSKTGYKGVALIGKRFRARIYTEAGGIHLGSYATAEEAAQAYNTKAEEIYGDVAILNCIRK